MEKSPTESEPQITREAVIEAYKPFIEQGITTPDNLDLNNPEVKAANELFDKWREQLDHNAEGNEEAELRANLDKTMFYVDAGFKDPIYLEEVWEWLADDAHNAEKQSDNPERIETRKKIAEAIIKVRHLHSKTE